MGRKINEIIIHCAATPNGKPFTVTDIDRWHQERGFHRTNKSFNPDLKAIGYHFVIYVDGSVHTGRQEDEIGAHCAGHNSGSIGICLIGTNVFTMEQWVSLNDLLMKLKGKYPRASFRGHRDVPDVHKECPGFDVATWLQSNTVALAGHVMHA